MSKLLALLGGLASPGRWVSMLGLAALVAGLCAGAYWIYGQGKAAGAAASARTIADLRGQIDRYTTAWAADSAATAKKEQAHAADTIHAADAYAAGQAAREAGLRADLADARRLLNAADLRAAGYRAQADSGAAACRGLADRSAALDPALAGGRDLVARLRGAVDRRDAEVALLAGLLDADDALMAQPAGNRAGAD